MGESLSHTADYKTESRLGSQNSGVKTSDSKASAVSPHLMLCVLEMITSVPDHRHFTVSSMFLPTFYNIDFTKLNPKVGGRTWRSDLTTIVFLSLINFSVSLL